MTEAGEQLRNRGLDFYKAHRDAEAYASWLPLAEQGHGESLFNMGIMTRDGLGVAADPQKGLDWMRKSVITGYAPAHFDLGGAYADGKLLPKNIVEAVRLWRKGAELGDTLCASHAGQYLFLGEGVPKDTTRGIALLMQAADAKNPDIDAQAMLGRIYLDGDSLKQDYVKARYWLEKAAEHDDVSALHNLALIYDDGHGVAIDKANAIALYERAASQGNSSSLNNLGYAYRHGEGVAKDWMKAVAYFEKSHALGNFDGTVNLGDMMFKGWGMPANRQKAVALYKIAAEAGVDVAQCRYAQALRYGDGVDRNVAEANRWKAKALARSPKLRCETRLDNFLVGDMGRSGFIAFRCLKQSTTVLQHGLGFTMLSNDQWFALLT